MPIFCNFATEKDVSVALKNGWSASVSGISATSAKPSVITNPLSDVSVSFFAFKYSQSAALNVPSEISSDFICVIAIPFSAASNDG